MSSANCLRTLGGWATERILIDSRTAGLTDLGMLLTGVLPDATVLVGGYGAPEPRWPRCNAAREPDG